MRQPKSRPPTLSTPHTSPLLHHLQIETRIQVLVTLFLSLVAIQYVQEADLPKSSYTIPSKQAVIVSYCLLGVLTLESLISYNLWTWPRVRSFYNGSREARRRQQAIQRARAAAKRGSDALTPRPSMFQKLPSSLTTALNRAGSWRKRGKKGSHSDDEGAARSPSNGGQAAAEASRAAPAAPVAAQESIDDDVEAKVMQASSSMQRRQAAAEQADRMEAELEAWWWQHQAWRLDVISFAVLCVLYLIALTVVFIVPVVSNM